MIIFLNDSSKIKSLCHETREQEHDQKESHASQTFTNESNDFN